MRSGAARRGMGRRAAIVTAVASIVASLALSAGHARAGADVRGAPDAGGAVDGGRDDDAAPSGERPHDLLVVVNAAAGVRETTAREVADAFLLRRASWPDGTRVTPIHAPASSELRASFARRALGMEPDEERAFWEQEKIRSGKRPPVEFTNPLRAVFALRTGVAYVFREDFRPGAARVVLVLPDEP